MLQGQRTAKGINVKELKDGWPGCLDAIDSLEAEGRILVTRHKKDQSPKMVWANDPSLLHIVDNEFKELWHRIVVPQSTADLRKSLIEYGLTPTSVVKTPVPVKQKEKKRKGARRGGKTTNTHMLGVLQDYSHLRRS